MGGEGELALRFWRMAARVGVVVEVHLGPETAEEGFLHDPCAALLLHRRWGGFQSRHLRGA